MNKLMYNKKNIAVFVLPALIIYVAIVVVPIIMTMYYGFFKFDGMGTMKFLGLKNFKDALFTDKVFQSSLIHSLILGACSTFIQLPIAFILAVILGRGVKFEKFFRTVYFIPVVISSMVIGQLFMKLFNGDHGLLNMFLKSIGMGSYCTDWLGNEKTAFVSTIIPGLWQWIGYYMLILYAGIKAIPEEINEAARIDGANGFQVVMHITLPQLASVFKVCVVLALTGSFKSFDLQYVMTGGGPLHASEVPATVMYANLFKKNLYGYGSAQAVIIIIECLIATVIVQKIFKNSEEAVSSI